MNSKTTGIWLVLAAALFGAVVAVRHYQHPVAAIAEVLPDLEPAKVSAIQIVPANTLEIRAERTNQIWQLTKPMIYPAQPVAIGALLDALQKLTPATRISAGELQNHQSVDAEFGFETPRFSIVIQSGETRRQLIVGNRTAPGDQVFLRVVGVEGAYVVDAAWLKYIPKAASDWRSTALVALDESGPDWIILTNTTKVIELRRDPTNQLWRMLRPLPARANAARITDLIERLRSARVNQFVTDDAGADLSAFGLRPADLSLRLGRDTNWLSVVSIGKSLTNDSSQVYARRDRLGAIVTTAKESFAGWHGTVNDFRDPYLLELTAPVAEIEVRGTANYTLQRGASNDWKVAAEKFPADAENIQAFIKWLANLRVSAFVKDVVTAPDWQTYGLAAPTQQIVLCSAVGDTNSIIASLAFGATQDGQVFVRRADENFVYAVTAAEFNNLKALYGESWEFRDRKIWNFSETNVAQITLKQSGKTRVLVRTGENKWALGAGSQGIINPSAIEETTHRLGQMTTYYWAGRNVTDTEKFGLNPDNLQITVELKTGEKLAVDFGAELPAAHTALAAVTLDGERWAFIFPPTLYQFVVTYLTIPPNTP